MHEEVGSAIEEVNASSGSPSDHFDLTARLLGRQGSAALIFPVQSGTAQLIVDDLGDVR